jgi:hypothetical protein
MPGQFAENSKQHKAAVRSNCNDLKAMRWKLLPLSARGFRLSAFGSWFLVLGSWFLVLGSWFLVLGSWFLVLGSWFLVLGSWFLVLDFPGGSCLWGFWV